MSIDASSRAAAFVGAATAIVLALGLGTVLVRSIEPADGAPRPSTAAAAARAFLDRYVAADGRVVRLDQGGDTVSEGQAYALLLAVAIDDEPRFERIWAWTAAHLQRDDGLLAWHWADGRVVDSEAATDADIDTARALLLAAERFGEPSYRQAALEIAGGVAGGEVVRIGDTPVLVAGPWARHDRVINPSYLAPEALSAIGRATGDPMWDELTASGVRLLDRLLGSGRTLPADWAVVDEHGQPRPVDGPGQGGEGAYGLDAVRVPLRLAEACDPVARRAAAELWGPLSRAERLAGRHALDGRPLVEWSHAAALVGAAAAADAAGNTGAAARLLDNAERLDQEHPSYYGSALVALGRVSLQSDRLGGCAH